MVSSILFVVLENSGTEVIVSPLKPSHELPFSIHLQLDSDLSSKHLLNTTNAQSTTLSGTLRTFLFNAISRWDRLHYSHLPERQWRKKIFIHPFLYWFSNLFTQPIFIICYVPGTIFLGTGDAEMKKQTKTLLDQGLSQERYTIKK